MAAMAAPWTARKLAPARAAIAFAAAVATAAIVDASTAAQAPLLTADTLLRVVNGSATTLVAFVNPALPRSARFLPLLAELRSLEASDSGATAISVVAADCGSDRRLVAKYAIRELPALRLFLRGQPVGAPITVHYHDNSTAWDYYWRLQRVVAASEAFAGVRPSLGRALFADAAAAASAATTASGHNATDSAGVSGPGEEARARLRHRIEAVRAYADAAHAAVIAQLDALQRTVDLVAGGAAGALPSLASRYNALNRRLLAGFIDLPEAPPAAGTAVAVTADATEEDLMLAEVAAAAAEPAMNERTSWLINRQTRTVVAGPEGGARSDIAVRSPLDGGEEDAPEWRLLAEVAVVRELTTAVAGPPPRRAGT